MGIINIVQNVKEIHPEYVVIISIGKFYYTYGKDSYIIAFLLNYKLNTFQNISRCGFSNDSIKRVIAKLEQNKVNYLILDRRNNYNVDEKFDNKNLNNYSKIFKNAKKTIGIKRRIENINEYLYSNIKNGNISEILNKMEEIINEGRKI